MTIKSTKLWNDTKSDKITSGWNSQPKRREIISRCSWSHQDMKKHQIQQNHSITVISAKKKKNHTKIQLIAPMYEMTPRQKKTKISTKTKGEKSYQGSCDHHKVIPAFITRQHPNDITHGNKILPRQRNSHQHRIFRPRHKIDSQTHVTKWM